MKSLKFVTRGEQTAQDKQKVYFCAHPDDYELYFKKISNEILDTLEKEKNLNCAFFYLEDANTERDSDFLASLKSKMNLFVMPVTKKLLTTENPALDIEFHFAIKSGIPVLPLMMEAGLEFLFNEKCGDLQFLDPNSRDATTISYEEKLTKYLTSILVSDELAQKIRKAFDAYIFLSYRKKDRFYAQELMSLIHKNDFCRDIAIWYDEFLIPGENFNQSIEDALNKSNLFALVVTPALLEKGYDKNGNECENYIVTTEYPQAKARAEADRSFSILPAEIIPTNKKILSEKYQGIPSCVSASNESALAQFLENALKGIALRQNNDDPEHNLFIGLAYLGGIDVEKNPERAVQLITSSAETGLPEAMDKLVSMHLSGELGKTDYDKAFEWEKKLVEKRRNIYNEKRDEESAYNYLTEMRYFAEIICYLAGRSQEAEEAYKEMLDASTRIYRKFKKDWSLRMLSASYDGLGKIQSRNWDFWHARRFYTKSIRISKTLARKTGADADRFKLSVYYWHIGNLYLMNDLTNIARYYYRKALDISIKIANQTSTENDYSHLAMAYYTIAHASSKRRIEYLNAALEIWSRLAQEYPHNTDHASRRDSVMQELGRE